MMRKILCGMAILLCSLQTQALVAPEVYVYDSSCPGDAPFRLGAWENYEDMDGGYYIPTGKCISCDSTRGLMLENSEDCTICSNRTFNGSECRLKKCPENKPIYESHWNWSGCKSCKEAPTHIAKEDCDQCPDLRWIELFNACVPNDPNTMYVGAKIMSEGNEGYISGGTVPFKIRCDQESFPWGAEGVQTSPEECARCSNMYMKGEFCYHK